MRLLIAALCLLVLCGAASAATTPTGSWTTVAQVEHTLKTLPLTLETCPNGCSYVPATGYTSGYVSVQVHVLTVTASGVGPMTRVAGTARYRLFNVRVCAIDYLQGGAKVSAHLLWHTASVLNIAAKRAKLVAEFAKIVDLFKHGGYTAALEKQSMAIAAQLQALASATGAAAAYAEDWQTRGLGPLMYEGC